MVAVNGQSGDVSILLGNGDGTFAPEQRVAVGVQPFGTALGDLNGDGELDIVVTNESSNSISVLLGAGDGSFTPQATVSPVSSPFAVTLAHMNGDAALDLVVARLGADLVTVIPGNGDGTFALGSALDYDVADAPGTIAVSRLT